ncbi:UNVERIFIED_CONTAM: hypothetical protein Sradi_7263700 [Sesamum radiatum]|uniref:Pollen Ole e 1 allergen and extensin family protein n=1 Tax=Sesamum radiatum TaxID=300843 RepID=A0AAW2ILE8_SESRA
MSSFLIRIDFVKMIFLVFVVLVFLGSPAIATGKLDLLAELYGREEMVKWAGYGDEKLSTVLIDGKLLCRGSGGNDEAYPVSGATVGVFCGARGKAKQAWSKGSTDSYGEFVIDVPSHLHAIPNLEKICHVKVVHLPTSSPCRQLCIGKHKWMMRLSSVGDGTRTYTTNNIRLMMPPQKHT